MHPDLKAWLHDPVQIAPYTGQDGYGSPQYGPSVSYLGRIERRFQTAATTTGAMLVEQTTLFLAEDAVIDERSQVTLDGSITPIQGLKLVQDIQGNLDHYQVFF